MFGKIDLKELERKAWRSVYEDGLLDMYLGMILALMGVSRLLDRLRLDEDAATGIFIGLMALALAGFFAGKRLLTVPRIGQVKFGAARRTRRLKTALVLFASVVLGLVLMLLSGATRQGSGPSALDWQAVMPVVWALNMLVVFGLMGYFLDFERLYFIGLLYAIPIPLDAILRERADFQGGMWIFLGLGAIIVAGGAAHLRRFLRDHPLPART